VGSLNPRGQGEIMSGDDDGMVGRRLAVKKRVGGREMMGGLGSLAPLRLKRW
jgi:hypothetical protein